MSHFGETHYTLAFKIKDWAAFMEWLGPIIKNEAALECERRQAHYSPGRHAASAAQGCATVIRVLKSKESEWERRQALKSKGAV